MLARNANFYLSRFWLKPQPWISDNPKFLLLVVIISAVFFVIPLWLLR